MPVDEINVQSDAKALDEDKVELFLDLHLQCQNFLEALASDTVSTDYIDAEMATMSGPLHLHLKQSGSQVLSLEVV